MSDRRYLTEFTLTEDHLKLAQRMYVGWADIEYGAPEINPKRPYGNSWVPGDIAEILGWAGEADDGDDSMTLSEEQEDRARAVHEEMETVLQIILCTQSFTPGDYVKGHQYNALSWKLKEVNA